MQVPEGGYYQPNINFPTPVRNGYTFTGWTTDGLSLSGIYVSENMEFIANWKLNN